jgi:hypothetical protein
VVWPPLRDGGVVAPTPSGSFSLRDTLVYRTVGSTSSLPSRVRLVSSWPAQADDRPSGVNLRLSALGAAWYELTGTDD